MQEVLDWLSGVNATFAHLFLGLSALVEYVFPPFPGDTVTLAGAALSARAGFAWWSVWLVLTLGSTLGGTMAWAFGRSLRRRQEHWPKFLQTPRAKESLKTLRERFEKRGAVYLAANRFVPAFRSLFFVAAGLSDLRLPAVAAWGAFSAALWNGAILALGFALGANIVALEGMLARYQTAAYLVLGLAAVGAFVWLARRRRTLT